MADGIINRIKLELDKQALRQLERDAAAASKRAAEAIANEISNSTSEGRAVQRFVGEMERKFQDGILKIRRQLANGLIDLPAAKKAAEALADTYNQEIEKGMKKVAKQQLLSPEDTARIVASAKVVGDKIGLEIHRSMSKELKAASKEFADSLSAKSGRAFNTLSIPDPTDLSANTLKRLRSKAKGDTDLYNKSVERMIKLHQLSGVEITRWGSLLNWAGINVVKSNAQVQALILRLEQLGVSKSRINKLLPQMNEGFLQLSGTTMKLARSLGLVYSAYQALQFIKSSVQDAADLEKAWARLAVTVGDFGKALSSVLPTIQSAIDLGQNLGFKQEQTLDTMARLIQITGDVDKSMKAHQTVLDIAASGYMTLEQATRNVGRAMIGDVGNLQRYGIFLEKNVDALDQLQKRFGGEALARSKTLRGQLDQVAVGVNNVKTALGGAVAEGVQSGGFMDTLKTGFQIIVKIIEENKEAIAAWASIFKYAFLGVVTILATVAWAFGRASSAVLTAFNILQHSIMALPPLVKTAFFKLEEVILGTLSSIAKYMDKVFHTDFAKELDQMVEMAKKKKEEAEGELAKIKNDAQIVQKEIEEGGKVGGGKEDQAVGNAKHPRARYFQQVRTEIQQLRRVGLADDLEESEKALTRLNELYEELNKQAEENKDNDKYARDFLAEMAKIETIRKAIAKDRAGLAAKEKAEAAITHRINLLGNIAMGEDMKHRMEAMKELNELHDQQIERRDKLNMQSKEYWEVQNHVKEIEDRISAVMSKDDTAWAKRVETLTKQVDLNIDAERAAEELRKEYEAQQKILEDTNKTIDERTTARLRQIQIEQALRSETDRAAALATSLIGDMDDPNKRANSQSKLITLRNQLNDKLQRGLVVSNNIAQVDQIILDITTALNEKGQTNLTRIEGELRAARVLAKHWKTREEAARVYEHILKEIDEALEKINLTEGERNRLIAQRQQAVEEQKTTLEPNLNVLQDLKSVLKNDVVQAFADAADESAQVFQTAFTYILRDARNLKHALSSIPKGLAAALLKELSELAQGKVKEHLAWTLSETAMGLGALAMGRVAAAGQHFASAGEHTAAAAAWGLVGGVTGSLGVSADTAYKNATDFLPGGATGDQGGSSDNMGKIGPDIYISFDPLDPNNPRHQDLVGETSAKYQQRYGGRIILRSAGTGR